METQGSGLSQAEIIRVFEALGLGTQEERDRFLPAKRLAPTLPSLPATFFVTRLSNHSEAQKTEDYQVAELG